MQKMTFGPLKCCVISNGAIYISSVDNTVQTLKFVRSKVWTKTGETMVPLIMSEVHLYPPVLIKMLCPPKKPGHPPSIYFWHLPLAD